MDRGTRRAVGVSLVILAACAPDPGEAPPPAADTAVVAAAANPWRPFWESDAGAVSALDTTRLAHLADGGVLAWVRLTYPDTGRAGDPFPIETRHVDTQHHVDCTDGAAALGHVVARDARERPLVELPTGDDLTFTRVAPETAGSALVALVCYTVGVPVPPATGGEG